MRKLGVDEKKIKLKFFAAFTLEQLNEEKAKVKNELKKYDSDFFEIFKVLPNRQEKEIMKPLYVYYKSIKNCIAKKENEQSRSKYNNANTSANNSGFGEDMSTLYENTYASNGAKQIHKKANSVSHTKDKNILIQQEGLKTEKKRSYSRIELAELEKEFYTIKNEQTKLKELLHNYQENFLKTNNRKVKFIRDIAPVQNEYNLYKEYKEKIKEIQEILINSKNNH